MQIPENFEDTIFRSIGDTVINYITHLFVGLCPTILQYFSHVIGALLFMFDAVDCRR